MNLPRYLLDSGVVANLVNVDSSYEQAGANGRLALFVDYRAGQPTQVQLVRMPVPVSLKVHLAMSRTDSA